MEGTKQRFGETNDGQEVFLYTLRNDAQMTARITNYGAILVSLEVADKHGAFADVVLGYDRLEDYINDKATYFGSTVGRYAGHIVGAKFTLDGQEYALSANDGANHLHGGFRGFNKIVWDAQEGQTAAGAEVKLQLLSQDGEEGYPGNLQVAVTYCLRDDNALQITYEAQADKSTPVSLTNHSYFNLAGHGRGDVLEHELQINADHYNRNRADLTPLGRLEPVTGTAMDFTQSVAIGARIAECGGGYDHNYALNDPGASPSVAARLCERRSGRLMEIHSTEPALQLYSGNFLDGSIHGKHGATYDKHGGVCLEVQQFPDAPNNSHLPSAILRPGETYQQKSLYRFSVPD